MSRQSLKDGRLGFCDKEEKVNYLKMFHGDINGLEDFWQKCCYKQYIGNSLATSKTINEFLD